MPLLTWILAAMTALAPGRDHAALGNAIATVLAEEAPLYTDDADRRRTAALVVAVAFRESTFRNDVVGDGGHSVCAMQIYDGPRYLLDEPEACIRWGVKMLRQSIKVDREHPVAFYARGPRWRTPQAHGISRDRTNLAGWLTRTVKP